MKKYGILSIIIIFFLFASVLPLNSTASHSIPPDAKQLTLGTNTFLLQDVQPGRQSYYFEPNLDQFYEIEIKVLSQSTSAEMEVYDTNATYIGSTYTTYNSGSSSIYAVDLTASGNFSIFVYSGGNSTREYTITISEIDSPDAYSPSDAITIELSTPQTLKVLPRTNTYLEINLPVIDSYAISISYTSGNITRGMTYTANINQSSFYESVSIQIDSKGYFTPSYFGLHSILLRGGVKGEITVEITQETPPDGYSFDYPLYVGSVEVYSQFYHGELYIKPTVRTGTTYLLNLELNSSSVFLTYIIVRDASTRERISEIALTGNTEKIYFYLQQSVVIEFEVDTLNEVSQPGISLQFEKTDTLPHSTIDDPESVDVGSNHVRTTKYPNQEYWFQFTAPNSKKYSFDLDIVTQFGYDNYYIYDDNGIQRGQASPWTSISFQLIAGETLFIKVIGSQGVKFNMQIFEGDAPLDITELVYSKNLQEGDYFSWEVVSLINGVPASDNQETPFAHGSIIKLEVLQDSPVINNNADSIDDYFAFSSDNQASIGFPQNFFISPMEIFIDGQSLASGNDVFNYGYFFGFNNHIEEIDGEIIITSEIIEFTGRYKIRVAFDKTNYNMISFELDIEEGEEDVYLKLSLIEAQVSGPSTDDDLKENEPALSVPFPIPSIIVSFIAIILIYTRKQY